MKAASRVVWIVLALSISWGCSSGVQTLTSPPPSFTAPSDTVVSTSTIATEVINSASLTPERAGSPTSGPEAASGIYIVSPPQYRVLSATNLTSQPAIQAEVIEPSPSGAQDVGDSSVSVFSHFSGMVAYWVQSPAGELWISDIDLKSAKRILTDSTNEYVGEFAVPYGAIRLLWSADDRYLIVDATQTGKQSLIYSIEEQTLEEWPWSCDAVALSPRTKQLATWCRSTEAEPSYAVMEWGGGIWISEQPPTQMLVSRGADQAFSWGWSRTGDKIAYFDPQDQQGRLFIADAAGSKQAFVPGIAWIGPITSYSFEFSSRYPIRWSRNGSRLLIFGQGTDCPPQESAVTGELSMRPCWQVIDSDTGQVLWTSVDISVLWPDQQMSDVTIEMAVFSPNSDYLALAVFRGGPRYIVLSAIQPAIPTILENSSGSDMYWWP